MEISVFGTPSCAKCKDVVKFLKDKKVEYMYMVIGEDVDHDHVTAVVGRPVRTVPVIMVNGAELTFSGLKERLSVEDTLGALEL